MSLTVTGRGNGGNNTAGTTVAAITSGPIAVGSLATLVVAYDNSSGGGGDPFQSITDDRGNTWTSRARSRNDPGAANAGLVLRILTSNITTALQTGDAVTITFSGNTTAKVWGLREWTASAGHPEFLSANAAETAGSSTSPTITTTSITAGNAVVAAFGCEQGTAQTYGDDTDTTNGAWENSQGEEVGNNGAGMGFRSHTKITTGTGTQTYDYSLGTSADWAAAWIEITEVPDPISGTSAVTAPNATAAATGTVKVLGTSALTAPNATLAATGDVEEPAGPVSGTSDVTAPAATVSASGTVRMGGTSSLSAPNATLDASGSLRLAATAALEAPAATLAATGSQRLTGTADVEAPAATLAAAGDVVVPPQEGEVEIEIQNQQSVSLGVVAHEVNVSIGNVHHVEVSVS